MDSGEKEGIKFIGILGDESIKSNLQQISCGLFPYAELLNFAMQVSSMKQRFLSIGNKKTEEVPA